MLRIKLHKTQYQVAIDQHRFRVLVAGRRWGKSVLSRMIVLKWAVENPGLYWIVSPTYKTSKMIHWTSLQDEIPNKLISKKNEVELSLTLTNGSVIQLRGAENPDSLRGVKLKGLVVDEVASIRNFDWLWSEVLRPTLTDYVAPALFLGTPKGFDHFYNLYNINSGNFKSFRFTTYDNPHISKAEVDKAKEELTEDVFAQEYLADFRKYTGLVYKEFNRDIHVKDIPDFQTAYWIRGLDRGFTNPTAVAIIAVDKDGNWYQTNEIYETQLTNPKLADKLREVSGERQFELSTMDSAAASDIRELADLGQDFIPVKKESGESGINYVSYKIQKLTERLRVKADGKPSYYIHPRCENTIKEFEFYRWAEKKNELSTEPESPEKLSDHMMDAVGDLNSTFINYYQPKRHRPGEGKLPGTYVTAYNEDSDNSNDFTSNSGDNYWTD